MRNEENIGLILRGKRATTSLSLTYTFIYQGKQQKTRTIFFRINRLLLIND